MKVLFWLEFLNTVQDCFHILYYSPFCENFQKHKGMPSVHVFIHLCKWVVGRGDIWMAEHGFTPAPWCHQRAWPVWVYGVNSSPAASVSVPETFCFFWNFSPVEHTSFPQLRIDLASARCVFQFSGRILAGSETIFPFILKFSVFVFSPPFFTQDALVIARMRYHGRHGLRLWLWTPMANMGYWAAVGEDRVPSTACLLPWGLVMNLHTSLGQSSAVGLMPVGSSFLEDKTHCFWIPVCEGPGWSC